jgi:bacillopeptidase F (M6 metalloprotease family)
VFLAARGSVATIRAPAQGRFTGSLGARALSYDLSAFAGHRVQIGFQFSSDEIFDFSGVYIDQITLH